MLISLATNASAEEIRTDGSAMLERNIIFNEYRFDTVYGLYEIPRGVVVDWAHSANPSNPIQYAYYVEGTQAALTQISEENPINCNPNGIDGIYGNRTYTAIYNFQDYEGLYKDGAAGDNTYTAMQGYFYTAV